MKDIELCNGRGCPFRNKCARYTNIPKKTSKNNLLWWVDPAYDKEVNKCRLFMKQRKEIYFGRG